MKKTNLMILCICGSILFSYSVPLTSVYAESREDNLLVDPAEQLNEEDITKNIKTAIHVPNEYVSNATGDGPFTAGVNSVIPYEAFGGDGMLTRLLLAASDGAPWSDNGTAKNAALLPLEESEASKYKYQLVLSGELEGKTGQVLIDQLKENGAKEYSGQVLVYDKDGSTVVATKTVSIVIDPAEQLKSKSSSNGNRNLKNLPSTGENISIRSIIIGTFMVIVSSITLIATRKKTKL